MSNVHATEYQVKVCHASHMQRPTHAQNTATVPLAAPSRVPLLYYAPATWGTMMEGRHWASAMGGNHIDSNLDVSEDRSGHRNSH